MLVTFLIQSKGLKAIPCENYSTKCVRPSLWTLGMTEVPSSKLMCSRTLQSQSWRN